MKKDKPKQMRQCKREDWILSTYFLKDKCDWKPGNPLLTAHSMMSLIYCIFWIYLVSVNIKFKILQLVVLRILYLHPSSKFKLTYISMSEKFSRRMKKPCEVNTIERIRKHNSASKCCNILHIITTVIFLNGCLDDILFV